MSADAAEVSGIVQLLDSANDLKLLPRTGWLLGGVPNVESVADHSFATALLALALAETINRAPHLHGLHVPLSLERVLKIALLHDLAEAVVTDLPKRATDAMGESAKHQAERHAWREIVSEESGFDEWRAPWEEYAEGASAEARLVRDADKLEMIHQALRYADAGNRRLDEFLADRQWTYPVASAVRQRLLDRATSRK